MIAFFDTSALLNMYFVEPGSDVVNSVWNSTELPCASILLVPEVLATFSRKRREGESSEAILRLAGDFRLHWLSIVPVTIDDAVLQVCDAVLQRHALRGADSVHLASALVAAESFGSSVTFVCADRQLAEAARIEGVQVVLTL